LYALIPAFLPLTKAPSVVTFFDSPQLSRWLKSLQGNQIGNLSLFSSAAGRRRSHTEQGQGSREGVGATKCCVLPEIHLW